MYQRQRAHHHRPASQGVRQDLHNNLTTQNVPSVNIMPVDKQSGQNAKISRNAAQTFHTTNAQQTNQQVSLSNHQASSNNKVQQTTENTAKSSSNSHQVQQNSRAGQQAHSMTRDLDAMGLMTQVKKGDDVRMQQKRNQNQASKQQAHGGGVSAGSTSQNQRSGKVLKNQDPNQLNLTNQQMYYLLKPQSEAMRGRKTLLLDVDETLVHSSFTPTDKADIVLPIDIEGRSCNIYVQVRPYCCEFIVEVAKYFEVVIFTASLSKYAIPLMDILDHQNVAPQRLFREHCTYFNGQFVKDMQRVGRRMEDTIIIDNSPNSYQFQPENGLPILSWYDEPSDNELMRFVPALKLLAKVDDIRPVILQSTFDNEWNVDMAIRICESLLILKEKQKKEIQDEKRRNEKQASGSVSGAIEADLPQKQIDNKDQAMSPSIVSKGSSRGPTMPHSDKTTKNEAELSQNIVVDPLARESDEAIVISKHKDSKHGSKSVKKEHTGSENVREFPPPQQKTTVGKSGATTQQDRSTIYDENKTRGGASSSTHNIEPQSILAQSTTQQANQPQQNSNNNSGQTKESTTTASNPAMKQLQQQSSRNQMGRLNTAGESSNVRSSGGFIANSNGKDGPGRSNTMTHANQSQKKDSSFTVVQQVQGQRQGPGNSGKKSQQPNQVARSSSKPRTTAANENTSQTVQQAGRQKRAVGNAQGFTAPNSNTLTNMRPNNRYHHLHQQDDQDRGDQLIGESSQEEIGGLSKTNNEEERMRNQVNSSEQFKIIKQRRMQKELANSEKIALLRQSRQQNNNQQPIDKAGIEVGVGNKDKQKDIIGNKTHNQLNHNGPGNGGNSGDQSSNNNPSSSLKKKTTNSLNPDKLKQYLLSSQQAGQANLDSMGFNKQGGQDNIGGGGRVLIKSSSRNLQDHQLAVSHTVGRQNHSHLNSVGGGTTGNVLMKNVMNSRTQNSVNVHSHHLQGKVGATSTQFQTSTTLGDKKESLLQGTVTSGLKNTAQSELRNSLKNGKRRANSNHAAEKKVNLDKFLSVVQQRSNFTPSSQLNSRGVQSKGGVGAPGSVLRGGASDLDKKYAQQMAVMNHKAIAKSAAVAERKQRIAGQRQNSNATEIAFGQKKLSLKGTSTGQTGQNSTAVGDSQHQSKQSREVVNKSGGVRGIQLNHNDIIFSKTMNLSQFLQAQTKGISGSHTTTHQNQPASPFVVGGSQVPGKAPRLVAQEISRQLASGSQKRNSSNQNNSRVTGQAAWVTTTNTTSAMTNHNPPQSASNKLTSKKNPYAVNQGASLNQIIGYQPGTATVSSKYQTGGSLAGNNANSLSNAAATNHANPQKVIGGVGGNSMHQLRNQNNAASSLTQKRMSAGSINPSGGVISNHHSGQNGGNSRSGVTMLVNGQSSSQNNMTQRNVSNSQGKIKSQMKKISQSSMVGKTGGHIGVGNNALSERENIHRGQSANREYQRSPGKIFNNGFQGGTIGNSNTTPNALQMIGPHSQSTKNQSQKQIQYNKSATGGHNPSSQQINAGNQYISTTHVGGQQQLSGKRTSKPQLMSELTLSLKNKKGQTQGVSGGVSGNKGVQGANGSSGGVGGYTNLIKPLVSAGSRIGPQTTKASSNILSDNFSSRSYTQRVVAAQAAAVAAGVRVNKTSQSPHFTQINMQQSSQNNQELQSSGQQAKVALSNRQFNQHHQQMQMQQASQLAKHGKMGKNNATTGDLNQSDNKMTPRKKIIKLVSNTQQHHGATGVGSRNNNTTGGTAQNHAKQQQSQSVSSAQNQNQNHQQSMINRGLSGQQNQVSAAQNVVVTNSSAGQAGTSYSSTHATLLNNYYQSLKRSKDSPQMNIEMGGLNSQVTAQGVQQHEIKQRQQIFSMLNDFEKTSRFNKEQIKNFGSPKNVNPSSPTQHQQTTIANQQILQQQAHQNSSKITQQNQGTGGKGAKQPKIRQQQQDGGGSKRRNNH